MVEAKQIFVDRTEFKALFEEAAFKIPQDLSQLLVFYGIGGQGKTALAHELGRIMAEGKATTYADLRPARLTATRFADPRLAVVAIRNGFAKAGVSFPVFDFAFALIWEKVSAEQRLPEFVNPWFGKASEMGGEFLADSILIGAEFAEQAATSVPALGYLLGSGAKWVVKRGREAWLTWKYEEIRELMREQAALPNEELVERLPLLLAQDLNRFVAERPGTRLVLLIDEYDQIFEGAGAGARWQRNRYDEFVYRFVMATKGILAIFFSRNRLSWEDDRRLGKTVALQQHALPGIKDDDAHNWLTRAGVRDATIRQAMIAGCRDPDDSTSIYPILLNMQLEHWTELKASNVEISASHFLLESDHHEIRTQKIVTRLLGNYTEAVQHFLQHVSLIKRFDRKIFETLCTSFNLPIPFENFDRITGLGLISELDRNWFCVNRVVAATIARAASAATRQRTLAVLVEHCLKRAKPDNIIDIDVSSEICLQQALEIRLSQSTEGIASWLQDAASTLHTAGRYFALEEIWQQTLAAVIEAQGPESLETAACWHHLAIVLDALGRYREAERLHRAALAVFTSAGSEYAGLSATANVRFAYNLVEQGVYAEEAIDVMDKSATMMPADDSFQDSETAAMRDAIRAEALSQLGRYRDAERVSRAALERIDAEGARFPLLVAALATRLATILDMRVVRQGRRASAAEATKMHRRAIEIQLKTRGECHPAVAETYDGLAVHLDIQGRYAEANKMFTKSRDICDKVFGHWHPKSAKSYINRATSLYNWQRYEDALKDYEKGYEIDAEILGDRHPDTSVALYGKGVTLLMLGRTGDAVPTLERAAAAFATIYGPEHPRSVAALRELATARKKSLGDAETRKRSDRRVRRGRPTTAGT